jgi:hypothetical protein
MGASLLPCGQSSVRVAVLQGISGNVFEQVE